MSTRCSDRRRVLQSESNRALDTASRDDNWVPPFSDPLIFHVRCPEEDGLDALLSFRPASRL